jgi:hypothetical protein
VGTICLDIDTSGFTCEVSELNEFKVTKFRDLFDFICESCGPLLYSGTELLVLTYDVPLGFDLR